MAENETTMLVGTEQQAKALEAWNNPNQVRELFAPKLSDTEFQFFMGMGRALKLNPFTREIWAVKYKSDDPAQIFVGRDGYRRNAQEQDTYIRHYVEAVYEKDDFKVVNGDPTHSFGANDRGKLMGAYGVLEKYTARGDKTQIFHTVRLSEYVQKRKDGQITKMWAEKPETMIKKVCEAQLLRMGYQGLFAGTYDGSEQWEVKADYHEEKSGSRKALPPASSKSSQLLQRLLKSHVFTNEERTVFLKGIPEIGQEKVSERIDRVKTEMENRKVTETEWMDKLEETTVEVNDGLDKDATVGNVHAFVNELKGSGLGKRVPTVFMRIMAAAEKRISKLSGEKSSEDPPLFDDDGNLIDISTGEVNEVKEGGLGI